MSDFQYHDSDRLTELELSMARALVWDWDHEAIRNDTDVYTSTITRLLGRIEGLEQQLRDWQDHLMRVHRVACDYPFKMELPEDYDE